MYNHPYNMPYWPPVFPWNFAPPRQNQLPEPINSDKVHLSKIQKPKKCIVGGKEYTTLEELYADPERKDPLIGMKYAVHVEDHTRSLIRCTLCDVEADIPGIAPHFLGFKHRKRYISQAYPEMLKPSKQPTEKLSKWEAMKMLARKVESMEGIKEIKIPHARESGPQPSKDGGSKETSVSCATNVPSVKASSDLIKNDEKSKDEKMVSCNLEVPSVTASKDLPTIDGKSKDEMKVSCNMKVSSANPSDDLPANDGKSLDEKIVSCNTKVPSMKASNDLPTNDGKSKDEKIVSSSVEICANTSTALPRNDSALKKHNKVVYPMEKLPDVKKQKVVKYLDSFNLSSDAEALIFLNLARNLSENVKKYRLQTKEVTCMQPVIADNDNTVDSSGCDMQVTNSDRGQPRSTHGKNIHSTSEKYSDNVQITKGESGCLNENLPRARKDDVQVSSSSNRFGKRSKTLTTEMLDILKGKDVNTVLQILQHLAPHYPALQDVNLEIFAHILSGNGALDFDT